MLSIAGDVLHISVNNEVFHINVSDKSYSTTSLPTTNISQDSKSESHPIVALAVSRSGEVVSLSDANKKIYILELQKDSWVIARQINAPKGVSKLLFSPCSDNLLISDKAGDLYKCPLSKEIDSADDLSLLCGHLSMIVDTCVSDDSTLLASCDRDEKIRVSRFAQPYVIESFCLGNSSFVSQISFVPNTHFLVSISADGYLKVWNSQTGQDIYSYYLDYNEIINEANQDFKLTDEEVTDTSVTVSRMHYVNSGIWVCCSSSHPIVFAFQLNIKSNDVEFSQLCSVHTPGNQPLLDCAVYSESATKFIVLGLTSENHAPLQSCALQVGDENGKIKIKWNGQGWSNFLPDDMKFPVPKSSPRLDFLKLCCKPTPDTSMIEAYTENKSQHHQKVLDRRLRHQHNRKRRKMKDAGDERSKSDSDHE